MLMKMMNFYTKLMLNFIEQNNLSIYFNIQVDHIIDHMMKHHLQMQELKKNIHLLKWIYLLIHKHQIIIYHEENNLLIVQIMIMENVFLIVIIWISKLLHQ